MVIILSSVCKKKFIRMFKVNGHGMIHCVCMTNNSNPSTQLITDVAGSSNSIHINSYVSVCCGDNTKLCIDLQDKSSREGTYE